MKEMAHSVRTFGVIGRTIIGVGLLVVGVGCVKPKSNTRIMETSGSASLMKGFIVMNGTLRFCVEIGDPDSAPAKAPSANSYALYLSELLRGRALVWAKVVADSAGIKPDFSGVSRLPGDCPASDFVQGAVTAKIYFDEANLPPELRSADVYIDSASSTMLVKKSATGGLEGLIRITHEVGHLFGLSDSSESGSIMSSTLPTESPNLTDSDKEAIKSLYNSLK